MKKINFVFLILLFFNMSCSNAQNSIQNLKISDLKFESIFGTNSKDTNSIYCLLGTGFFRTPRSENSDTLIYEWLNTHPNAVVVPVSAVSPIQDNNQNSKMIYCWVIENTDTINNYLIKNGCFPGGTMMRQNTYKEMKKWEKEMYRDLDEKPNIKIYVNKKTYKNFIEQMKTAEIFARENKLGIWADDFPYRINLRYPRAKKLK